MVKANAKNKAAIPTSHMESTTGNEPLAKKKVKGLDSPCRINLHSRRYRLTDADGCSGKAAIDGIVHAGILPDDSAKYVEKVTFTQEKIKKPEIEETIIEITGGPF